MFRQEIISLLKGITPSVEDFDVSFQDKDSEKFGHYSTNIALVLGKKENKNPMDVAHGIIAHLEENKDLFEKVEVVPPGFINLWLTKEKLSSIIPTILEEGDIYGSNNIGKGKKVRIEYISANPTGPIHIGNARGGPIGEVIARVMERSGYYALREYLHNDVGGQVEKMGNTVFYWYEKLNGKNLEFPENGYPGEYFSKVAKKLKEEKGDLLTHDNFSEIVEFALNYIFRENFETISQLGVHFDSIIKESDFIISGKTDGVIEELKEKKVLKEKDGALWFQPNDEFLEDRETVVKKSDGKPTYFASDIAYHKEKFLSGYDIVIDVLGSNHHGHVPKLKALTNIFGFDPAKFFVILYQYVRLKRGDEIVKMAKRDGNYVTAKEVLDEVGKDSMIFSFLMNSVNTHVDFDLELVKSQSMKNPVFYVQYAYVRAVNILEKVKEEVKEINTLQNFSKLTTNEDTFLIRKLEQFSEIIEDTARDFEIQRLTRYATELARAFHAFYENERVVGEEDEIMIERYLLVTATAITLKNLLNVVGISTPKKM